jgi:23S rRNA (uracil1939-C5)-methyltransferase
MSVEASLQQKRAYLARVLHRWSDRLGEVVSVEPQERLGYRDRVTLTARWDSARGWAFGLVRRDELIAIHDCPVHGERVRRLVKLLVRALPSPGQFPLAYLHVSGAQATLIAKARHASPALLGPVVEGLSRAGIEGLWLHCHPSAGRRLFARSGWTLVAGAPRSRDPSGLLHGPTSFAQVQPALHAAAVAVACEHLRATPDTAVLDLYSGHGSTLREWVRRGSPSLGVELSGEAVELARVNAPGAEVLRGTCVDRLPQVREWWRRGDRPRVAYLNPPRSGLDEPVAAALAQELRPVRIAYLSCSGGTLARDLAVFDSAGYRIQTILPYDFFPFTHHVEALALLRLPP